MINPSTKKLLRAIAIQYSVLKAIAPPDFTIEQGRTLLEAIKEKEQELNVYPHELNYQKIMLQHERQRAGAGGSSSTSSPTRQKE